MSATSADTSSFRLSQKAVKRSPMSDVNVWTTPQAWRPSGSVWAGQDLKGGPT